MAKWHEIQKAEPEFAARVRELFDAHRHKTLATLRKDGSPRISGTEVEFTDDGDVRLGMMPDSLKLRDVLRDPRVAVHSGSEDPDDDNPAAWPGDAKFAGIVQQIESGDKSGPPGNYFSVDVTEVVLTRVADSGDHLEIKSWHPDRGLVTRQRA